MITKRSEKILGAFWLALCTGLALYFLIFCRGAYLDSDMSSELMLAELLSREGGIISKNWYYSTELRVLNTQLVFAPLFLLFDNWHTVRVVGTLILWGILLASYWWLLKGLDLNRWFCLTAGFFLLPFSTDHFKFTVLGTYYIPHISISLVSMGLMMRLNDKSPARDNRILLSIGCLLAIAAGLGGIRQLAVLYVPLFVSCAFLFLFQRDEKRRMLASLCLLIFSALGYLGNQLLKENYHFFSYNQLSLQLDLTRLLALPRAILGCFGWNSLYSGTNELLIAAPALLLFFIMMGGLICCRRLLNRNQLLVLAYFLSGLLVLTGIFCVTNMEFSVRYYLPVFIFIFPLIAAALNTNSLHYTTLLLICTLLLSSVVTGSIYYRNRVFYAHKEIAEALESEGYTQGFASFWNSNILTEYSHGRIETWTFTDKPINSMEWLQKTYHKEHLPEGKCFLLLENSEGPVPEQQPFMQSGNYSLYSFADQFELKKYLCGWYESFEGDYAMVSNGEDINGQRILTPGGFSYGPYISLLPGQYEVSIRGKDLDKASYDFYRYDTDTCFDCTVLEHSDNEIRYLVSLPERSYPIEMRIFNNSDNTIILDEVDLSYISSDYCCWYESFSTGNNWLINGTDKEGFRYLAPGGISFGPYMSLSAGNYEVKIYGNELNLAEFDLCTESGTTLLPFKIIEHDEDSISYTFSLQEDVENIEFRVFNNSTEIITLDEISVSYIAPG